MTGHLRIDPRLGTFEEVAAASPAHAGTLAAVQRLGADLHPDAYEGASRRERSVSWRFGVSKACDWFAYAMPRRAHVNLGFFRGTHLPDPEGVLEGRRKVLRHMELRAPDDARHPRVLALLSAARDKRACALNLDQGS